MNETKKNAMNHIGHVLGKVAIHTDFENLGVFGPGDYTYIYTYVCVCVCVYILRIWASRYPRTIHMYICAVLGLF